MCRIGPKAEKGGHEFAMVRVVVSHAVDLEDDNPLNQLAHSTIQHKVMEPTMFLKSMQGVSQRNHASWYRRSLERGGSRTGAAVGRMLAFHR